MDKETIKEIKLDLPDSFNSGDLPNLLSEQEAYRLMETINRDQNDHHAVIEGAVLKVYQVLMG